MPPRRSGARDLKGDEGAGPSRSLAHTPSSRLASQLKPVPSPKPPRKARASAGAEPGGEAGDRKPATRTPLGKSPSNRATPSSARATPTPHTRALGDEPGSTRAVGPRKRENGVSPGSHGVARRKQTGTGHGRSLSLADIALPPRSMAPVTQTPVRQRAGHQRTASLAQEPSLGSAIAQALPTPSPRSRANGTAPRATKRQRLSSPVRAVPARNTTQAEVFADSKENGIELEAESDPEEAPDGEEYEAQEQIRGKQAISRDTFLANEALRRQREARNFIWKGDENAPKLTRSGRIIATRAEADHGEADEYGAVVGAEGADPEDPGEEGEDAMDVDEPENGIIPPKRHDLELNATPQAAKKAEVEIDTSIAPLPAGARPHVIQILETLTSAHIDRHPPPFEAEEANEALQGLLSLLKGTVERGEGNSALITGARGVGKTRTVARALDLLRSSTAHSSTKQDRQPIIVRLSGHAQTNDRLAIREMGRQIAEAEGKVVSDATDAADGEDAERHEEEYAPTTLPSHLLALLTEPSPRAIIIIIEEFDLFTEHARQALLYCLLDVVQRIKTGPVESTGRGVAVIGVTTRVDTLLLLEKRVKSRFSHRMWRVQSPLALEGKGWKTLVKRALVPWLSPEGHGLAHQEDEDEATENWKADWDMALDLLLDHPKITRHMERLSGLTTDMRLLYRPFTQILPVTKVLNSTLEFLTVLSLISSVLTQIEGASWSLPVLAPGSTTAPAASSKLRGLPHPCLGVLIIAKHLSYAGREEWNFVQVEEEYLRFARTRLVGSGKVRWPVGVLRAAFDNLLRLGVLVPTGASSVKPPYAKVRCLLSPHEIVAFFKGDGAVGLGPELTNWGRIMGGHA